MKQRSARPNVARYIPRVRDAATVVRIVEFRFHFCATSCDFLLACWGAATWSRSFLCSPSVCARFIFRFILVGAPVCCITLCTGNDLSHHRLGYVSQREGEWNLRMRGAVLGCLPSCLQILVYMLRPIAFGRCLRWLGVVGFVSCQLNLV